MKETFAKIEQILLGVLYAFHTPIVIEPRIQIALAQFIRSIQSFDSRYDKGRRAVNNRRNPFTNFTAQENLGKRYLWMAEIRVGLTVQVAIKGMNLALIGTQIIMESL